MTTAHRPHHASRGELTTSRAGACLVVAGVFAVGVIAFVAWAPIDTVNTGRAGVQPRFSILHVQGTSALLVAWVPAIVTLVVAGLLAVGGAHRAAHIAAWTLAIALALAAFAGTVTLLAGAVALPTAVALMAACAQTRPDRS